MDLESLHSPWPTEALSTTHLTSGGFCTLVWETLPRLFSPTPYVAEIPGPLGGAGSWLFDTDLSPVTRQWAVTAGSSGFQRP